MIVRTNYTMFKGMNCFILKLYSAINEVVHRITNFFTLYVQTRAYASIKHFRQKRYSNIKYKHEPAPQVLEW